MKNKIKIARKILNNNYGNGGNCKLEILKDLVEKAELTYNDVKIKKKRSMAALENMKKIEYDIEQILREVKN